MNYKLRITCCLCRNKHVEELQIPDGWSSRHSETEDESGFCPDHANIKLFSDSQCPGCVGGWGDCSLFDSFAYSGRRSIAEGDIAKIRKGICPKRVNGTFGVGPGGVEAIDLTEKPDTLGGIALADAILEYMVRYSA